MEAHDGVAMPSSARMNRMLPVTISTLLLMIMMIVQPDAAMAWQRNSIFETVVDTFQSYYRHGDSEQSRKYVLNDDKFEVHRRHLVDSIMRTARGGDIHYPPSEEALDKLLDDAAANDQLVVIDFYNDNCPPCEKLAPLFLELSESEEFIEGGAVIFVKIKVDDHPDIANRYGITGWPTFLFIKKKEVQTEIVGGALAEATLYDWIRLFTRKPTKLLGEESSTTSVEACSNDREGDTMQDMD